MKLIETLRIRATSRVRREKARLGLGQRPARLDIRLDGFDAPLAGDMPGLTLEAWQERVVELLQWAGPMPVRITAHAGHALLPDLVRFCHRLEMPVTVRTGPDGLSGPRAEELLDRGMQICELVATTLEGPGEEAVRALVHARNSRGVPLTVHVHIPITEASAAGARANFEAARGLGADGVVLCPPWQGLSLSATAGAAVAAALAEGWPLQKTSAGAREVLGSMRAGGPGAPRKGGKCELGGLRLALLPDGKAVVCPFKPGMASGPLADSAGDLGAHRDAIRRCDRVCGHPELV